MNEEVLSIDEQVIQEEEKREGIPIGGWLILLGIGTTLNPFTIAYSIYMNHIRLIMSGQLGTVDSYIRNLVYFELLMNSFILIVSVIVLIGYYSRKKWFKKVWFILIGSMLLSHTIDYFALKQSFVGDPSMFSAIGSEITKAVIMGVVWGSYLHVSERVKNTFVR